MDREEAVAKITGLVKTDPRADEVGLLLLNFGIELVACGNDTIIRRDGEEVGQIDLIFADNELKKYFFIEVSKNNNSQSKKIDSFFRKWENSKNITAIRKLLSLRARYKIVYLYFDLSGREGIPGSVTIKSNQYILNEWDLNYFLDANKKIGKLARNDFMSHLNIKPRETSKEEKKAIQFFIGDFRAYVYVDSVKELLGYCYVFRRKNREHAK